MKFHQKAFRTGTLLLLPLCLCVTSALAWQKKNDAKPEAKTVDSGSFGVFVKGQRVATESFHIQQGPTSSTIKSELKQTAGANPVTQKSDLQVTSAGELVVYNWSQSSGGSITVLPNNEFLLEKINNPTLTKTAEQPFLMPNTSVILDNNFFIHREVLIWRYLAANCKTEGGSFGCQKTPAEFGVLIPQDRNSARIRLELVGDEKVSIRGTERTLLRLNLKSDNFDWGLWVDTHDQFKLIRVAIPADETEVVRD